jgi:hypothetical protein
MALSVKTKKNIRSTVKTADISGFPDKLALPLPASVTNRFPELVSWKEDLDFRWSQTLEAIRRTLDGVTTALDEIPVATDLSKTWALDNPVDGLSSIILEANGPLRLTRITSSLTGGSIQVRFRIIKPTGVVVEVSDPFLSASESAPGSFSGFTNDLLSRGDLLKAEIVSNSGVTSGSFIIFYRELNQ